MGHERRNLEYRALEYPRKWAETRNSPGGRGRERGADFSGTQLRGTVPNILAQPKGK